MNTLFLLAALKPNSMSTKARNKTANTFHCHCFDKSFSSDINHWNFWSGNNSTSTISNNSAPRATKPAQQDSKQKLKSRLPESLNVPSAQISIATLPTAVVSADSVSTSCRVSHGGQQSSKKIPRESLKKAPPLDKIANQSKPSCYLYIISVLIYFSFVFFY